MTIIRARKLAAVSYCLMTELSLWTSGQRVSTQRLKRMRFRPLLIPMENQKSKKLSSVIWEQCTCLWRICLKKSLCDIIKHIKNFPTTDSFIMWNHAAPYGQRTSSCRRWPSSRKSWVTCRLNWAMRSRAMCSPSTEAPMASMLWLYLNASFLKTKLICQSSSFSSTQWLTIFIWNNHWFVFWNPSHTE